MLDPYFSKELSSRQIQVLIHYFNYFGVEPNDVHYIKTEEFYSDLFPVDLVVIEPNSKFDYYTIATVGLSEYKFEEKYVRSELLLVLPKEWKPIFDKEQYYWAPALLKDVAYASIENKRPIKVGQVYLLNEEGKTYSPSTDAVGAIVTIPEMYDFDMYEEFIDETYTKFFQIVPIENNDIKKLEEIGPMKFIQFDLRDSEKPLMVAKLKEKAVQGIDKLVKQNESKLKSKK